MTEEVRVNKNSPTEIDFDIQIEGINSSKLDVRFIVEQVNGFDLMLSATHIKDNKWKVVVPAFNKFDKDEFQLRIEVIADGYFFVPIKNGKLSIITDPVVSLPQKETEKSQQKSSLEETSKKDALISEKQNESQDLTEQPPLISKKTNDKTSTRNIVSNIINIENLKKINNTYSKNKNQKSLFFRAKNKKLIVPGITEDEEYYQQLSEKEKKVKQILKEFM